MRANLGAAGTALMTESVVGALAARIGRAQAGTRLRAATARAREQGRPLELVLAEDEQIGGVLGPGGLRAALDPERYLGVSDALMARAQAFAREAGA
jgi:adenylosuccinate lyase